MEKKFFNKLSLQKETIANLSHVEQSKFYGGNTILDPEVSQGDPICISIVSCLPGTCLALFNVCKGEPPTTEPEPPTTDSMMGTDCDSNTTYGDYCA